MGCREERRGKERWTCTYVNTFAIPPQKDKSILIIARDNQLKAKDQEMVAIEQLISAKESEISEKDRGLLSLQQKCGSLQTQLETVQRRNQSLEVSGFRWL